MPEKNQLLSSTDKEFYSMYYEHQYDRMKELENQRLIMTNVIVGLSVLSFSLAFEDITKLNTINAIGLPFVVLIANLIAVIYNHRSRAFIKMHQRRAHEVLKAIAPDVNRLNQSIPKPINSNKDLFSRPKLQTYLHVLLMAVSLLPVFLFLCK